MSDRYYSERRRGIHDLHDNDPVWSGPSLAAPLERLILCKKIGDLEIDPSTTKNVGKATPAVLESLIRGNKDEVFVPKGEFWKHIECLYDSFIHIGAEPAMVWAVLPHPVQSKRLSGMFEEYHGHPTKMATLESVVSALRRIEHMSIGEISDHIAAKLAAA